MSGMYRELGVAVRSLARSPGFVVVTVLTMAVGIGANAAIFSVIYGVLFAPVPYEDADRIVQVQNRYLPSGTRGWVSGAELAEFRAVGGVLDAIVPITPENMNLTGLETPLRLEGMRVGPGYFRLLGVEPILGREFVPEEGAPGGATVAMLSESTWITAFGADPEVVGRTVELDGVPRTVVGIVGSDHRPISSYLFTGRDEAFWVPLVIDPTTFDAQTVERHNLLPIGRLGAGVDAMDAERAMVQAVDRLVAMYPEISSADSRDVAIVPLRDRTIGGAARTFMLLSVAVGLVLIVACVNVANLFVARADTRLAEAAVRVAMGADRARILWYGMSEAIVVALAGGALGLLVTSLGRGLLSGLIPSNIAIPDGPELGGPVLIFTVLLSLAAGCLAGFIPASRLAAGDVFATINAGSGATGPRRDRGALLGRTLVIGQVAGAVVLVVGASLLVRSLTALRAVDPGFAMEDRHLVPINATGAGYPDPESVSSLYTRLLAGVTELPGVESAAVSWQTPQQIGMSDWPVYPESAPDPDWYQADPNLVSPGFFETYDIDLVEGRAFDPTDAELPIGPVILNRTGAERLWPGESAIGRRVNLSFGDPVWREVIGVVDDVRGRGLALDPRIQTYMTFGEGPFAGAPSLTLTTQGPLAGAELSRGVLDVLKGIDPDIPVTDGRALESQVSSTIERERMLSVLFSLFAGVTLALGAIGVYGIVSFSVRQRTREIGLRIALGARPAEVVGGVVRQGVVMAAVGVAVGLAASALTGQLLESFLFGVSRSDPVTMTSVAAAVMVVALAAAFVPARQAATVDPVRALKD